jgi:membrane protein YqaA with SNARE-associated domain
MKTMNEMQINSLAKENVKSWEIHKRLYNWVLSWAQTRYGMAALIILAITEPICIPVPADVMVMGMSLGNPRKAIRYGLICSFFSVMGGTIALLLGMAIGGDNVISFFDSISAGPLKLGEKADTALRLYNEYDFWAIAISALTPVPYMIFSWLGGMAGVSVVKFIAISAVFRTLRFGTEGVLFYLFGVKARTIIEKHFNIATIIVMALLAAAVLTIKLLRH